MPFFGRRGVTYGPPSLKLLRFFFYNVRAFPFAVWESSTAFLFCIGLEPQFRGSWDQGFTLLAMAFGVVPWVEKWFGRKGVTFSCSGD
jgi:hypothetical protein